MGKASAAIFLATTSGTRPQPNSETSRDDEAETAESGSAGRELVRPEEHEHPESKNERQESAHDRIVPGDQDDDSGCI